MSTPCRTEGVTLWEAGSARLVSYWESTTYCTEGMHLLQSTFEETLERRLGGEAIGVGQRAVLMFEEHRRNREERPERQWPEALHVELER